MVALSALGVPSAAVNLRGRRGSEGQERLQEWKLADYEVDVLRALDSLAEPAPLLVGHSMGGLIAQRVAARTPLRGLVLMASSPVGGMRKDGLRMAMRHPLTFLMAAWKRSFLRLYEDPRVCRSLLLTPDSPEPLVRQVQQALVEESWQAADAMNHQLPDPAAVACPVTVMGGTADAMVSPASVLRTARAYGVEPDWFNGCGHMLPLEAPPEALAMKLAALSRARPTDGQQRTTT